MMRNVPMNTLSGTPATVRWDASCARTLIEVEDIILSPAEVGRCARPAGSRATPWHREPGSRAAARARHRAAGSARRKAPGGRSSIPRTSRRACHGPERALEAGDIAALERSRAVVIGTQQRDLAVRPAEARTGHDAHRIARLERREVGGLRIDEGHETAACP